MRKFLLIATLGALMASCAQEEIPQTPTTNGTPLTVSSASIANIVTKGIKLKDAIQSPAPSFTTDSKIGVYLLNSDNYSATNNVPYHFTSASTSWAKVTSDIYLNDKPASLCAYYPYNTSGIHSSIDGTTWSTDPTAVTLNSQLYKADKDLCYSTILNPGPTNNTTEASKVKFEMKHAYSAITFVITKGLTYTGGTGAITNITISNSNLLQTNSIDITSGTYNSNSVNYTKGNVSFNPGIEKIDNSTDKIPSSVSTTVLMVPTKVGTQIISDLTTGEINLSFTIDNKQMSAKLTAGTIASLLPGNNYTIKVTLQGTALVVTSVTIAEWENQPEVNGGSIN